VRQPLSGPAAFFRFTAFALAAQHGAVATGMLNDMRQFMHQQPLPISAVRYEAALRKHDLAAGGKRFGPDFRGGLGGRRAVVNADMGEVAAKAGLDVAPDGRVERATRLGEGAVDRCRRFHRRRGV
jgi:hypothetical protein